MTVHLVVGHQLDPFASAEQLFIVHLLVLPGMKRQGNEFVSLLHCVLACMRSWEKATENRMIG